MERIGDPLRDLLAKLRLTGPMKGWRAVELWPEVVGERIAAHTKAVAFRDGTLIIEVDSPAWMNELTYMRRRLAAQMNRRLGKDTVRAVRLRPASGSAPRTHDAKRRGYDSGTR